MPLTFESNQGQADRRVRFLAHSGESTLFLTPTEAVFTMAERKPASRPVRGTDLRRSKHLFLRYGCSWWGPM
jgi:hypothetical protein